MVSSGSDLMLVENFKYDEKAIPEVSSMKRSVKKKLPYAP
jgi:hypothetical protein